MPFKEKTSPKKKFHALNVSKKKARPFYKTLKKFLLAKGYSFWSLKFFYLQKREKKLAKLGRFINRKRECYY